VTTPGRRRLTTIVATLTTSLGLAGTTLVGVVTTTSDSANAASAQVAG
jgi:hypothetical protein